jgi:hypothetical protein
MQQLRGHSANIKQMVFSKNDQYLYSCDIEGVVFEWNMVSWSKRDWESKYDLNSFAVTRGRQLLLAS